MVNKEKGWNGLNVLHQEASMAGACDYTLDEEGDDEVFKQGVETTSRNLSGGAGDRPPLHRRTDTIDRYGFIRAPGLPDHKE